MLATENPIEQEGTFPLPEAQLDRFFLRTALGYPSEDDELAIVEAQRHAHPLTTLRPALGLDDVLALRRAVEDVYVDDAIRRWTIQFVRATREVDGIAIGASVRGSLALERAIRAWALLDGRDYVTPVDVERLFLPVVLHRIVFTPSFVATAREVGWEAASDGLREQCLALAPRPGAELEAVGVGMRASLLAVAGVVALAAAQAGTGAESASRIVDRTLLCRMTGVGYPDPARLLRVGAATYDAANGRPAVVDQRHERRRRLRHEHSDRDRERRSGSQGLRAPRARRPVRLPAFASRSREGRSREDRSRSPRASTATCRHGFWFASRGSSSVRRDLTRDGASGDLVHGYLAVATSPDRKPIVFTSIGGGSQQTKVFVSATVCKEDS